MSTRTNLSELALKNSTLTLFFMLLLTLAGVFAYFSLGRAEDPPFTIKKMVVSDAWPGRPRDGAAGHRQPRDQAAGAALVLQCPELHQAGRDGDLCLGARRRPA